MKAKFDFQGEQSYDLSFKAGDVITVLTQTGQTDDWWEGKLNGQVGLFPANRCEAC